LKNSTKKTLTLFISIALLLASAVKKVVHAWTPNTYGQVYRQEEDSTLIPQGGVAVEWTVVDEPDRWRYEISYTPEDDDPYINDFWNEGIFYFQGWDLYWNDKHASEDDDPTEDSPGLHLDFYARSKYAPNITCDDHYTCDIENFEMRRCSTMVKYGEGLQEIDTDRDGDTDTAKNHVSCDSGEFTCPNLDGGNNCDDFVFSEPSGFGCNDDHHLRPVTPAEWEGLGTWHYAPEGTLDDPDQWDPDGIWFPEGGYMEWSMMTNDPVEINLGNFIFVPFAQITPTPTDGPEDSECVYLKIVGDDEIERGDKVTFKAEGYDPDGDIQRYRFDFGDDGDVLETDDRIVTHRYEEEDNFTARVHVQDSHDEWITSDNCEVEVDVEDEDDDSGCSDLEVDVEGQTTPPYRVNFKVRGYDDKGDIRGWKIKFNDNTEVKDYEDNEFHKWYQEAGKYSAKAYIKNRKKDWLGGSGDCKKTFSVGLDLDVQPKTGIPEAFYLTNILGAALSLFLKKKVKK